MCVDQACALFEERSCGGENFRVVFKSNNNAEISGDSKIGSIMCLATAQAKLCGGVSVVLIIPISLTGGS